MLKDSNNNLLKDLAGNFLAPPEIPKIQLTFASNVFPPERSDTFGSFHIKSTPNTIYIDFGDGSPIFSEDFSGDYSWRREIGKVYNYPDSSEKTVKIWFKYPSKLGIFELLNSNYIKNFPTELGLYPNLNTIILINLTFGNFPVNSGSISVKTFIANNISISPITSIPLWVTRSKIQNLRFVGGVNFSNIATSNLDKLYNILGLYSFVTSGFTLTEANFPASLKDSPTLRQLGMADLTNTIYQKINDCRQLTHLSYGHTSYFTGGGGFNSSGNFSDWGVGVGGMTNLIHFSASMCVDVPSSLPLGMETSGLKTVDFRGSFRTEPRMTALINDTYSRVVATASMTTGNTVMRNIFFDLGAINTNPPYPLNIQIRPTGTYQQPTGYVQGSSNGSPASPMEKVWVLIKQYGWRFSVINAAANGIETLS